MAIITKITQPGNNQVSSLDGGVRLDEGNGRFVVSNGQNNLGIFGPDSTGKTVVKIAKEGFDADTATDDQLIFNSEQNVFKIVKKISKSFSISAGANGGTGSITIDHNLGYVPLIFGSVTVSTNTVGLSNGSILMLPVKVPGITGIQNSTTQLPVDFLSMSITSLTTSNLNVGWSLIFGSNSVTGLITLYVLQETAS